MTRLVFIQHGDYRSAVERFAAGGEETYYAQRHTVEYVAALAQRLEHVAVICVKGRPYGPVRLDNGVVSLGMSLWQGQSEADLLRVLAEQKPTHVVLRAPFHFVLREAARAHWQVLPILADSFEHRGLRHWWRHLRLRRLLNAPSVAWVGNHGLNASRSLARIGVKPSKIVPYDVPPPFTPAAFPPKQALDRHRPTRLLYAGKLSWDKGVGDLIDAVAQRHAAGCALTLTVLGEDPEGQFASHARQRGVGAQVTFAGRVPHREVLRNMHEHDIIVVPSRHDYAEGIPFTIYDAYCSRTPLVVSDHPMFAGNVVHGQSGLIFKAADPAALGDALVRLIGDEGLYRRLSHNSLDAWRRMQMDATWADLITRFIDGPERHADWLHAHCLAAVEHRRSLAPRPEADRVEVGA